MKIRAGEHNHSEKVIHVAKAKSSTDDEFDLVVDGLGAGIRKPECSGSNNGIKVAFDFHTQLAEHGDPASLGPGHPLGERSGDVIRSGLESQTNILFEQVGTIEFRIGLSEELQLGLLIYREMLWIFEQGVAEVLHSFRLFLLRSGFTLGRAAGLALGQSFGLLASLGPSLPSHLIQCVCGPGNYVEWVYTPLGVGTVFLYAGGNPPGSIR